MKMENNKTGIYRKLAEARVALQSLDIKKTGRNEFPGYDYFELSDFLPDVQKIFLEKGLCGIVTFSREFATLWIHDVEEPGAPIVITSPMESANLRGCHPIQNLGAVETYQRRYLWIVAMEIVEFDAISRGNAVVDQSDGGNNDDEGLPEYTSLQLENNVEAWKAAIAAGKLSADKIIAKISSGYRLTQKQIKRIKTLEESSGSEER